jgi:hypothetical protein
MDNFGYQSFDLAVTEVCRKCQQNGIHSTRTLAAVCMKFVLMKNKGILSHTIPKAIDYGIVDSTVKMMSSKNDPLLETIKMQVSFDTAVLQEDERLNREISLRTAKEEKLIQAIGQHRSINPTALEGLFGNIVSYVIVKSRLGSFDDRNIRRETAQLIEKALLRPYFHLFSLLCRFSLHENFLVSFKQRTKAK